jgi:hypothetical protein
MANKTWMKCLLCTGNGDITIQATPGDPGGTIVCSRCNGEKVEVVTAIASTEENARIMFGLEEGESDNIFESYVVLECLDATEWSALTSTQKDGVKAILMCGLVDLNDGKAGKTRLWNWFGSESTTIANITALLE